VLGNLFAKDGGIYGENTETMHFITSFVTLPEVVDGLVQICGWFHSYSSRDCSSDLDNDDDDENSRVKIYRSQSGEYLEQLSGGENDCKKRSRRRKKKHDVSAFPPSSTQLMVERDVGAAPVKRLFSKLT
jgi:hypothetical protein